MTTTVEREQADTASQGSCGTKQGLCGSGESASGTGQSAFGNEQNAYGTKQSACGTGQSACGTEQSLNPSETAQEACHDGEGCGINKNFFGKKRPEEKRSKEDQSQAEGDEMGRKTRRKIVNRARVILVVGLTLGLLSELGGGLLNNYSRHARREFIADSMAWDLQSGGTAIGVYPSSRNDICSRWASVARDDERSWQDEDNARAVIWLMLIALSSGVGYLFFAPKGKALIEGYIQNGVPQQAI